MDSHSRTRWRNLRPRAHTRLIKTGTWHDDRLLLGANSHIRAMVRGLAHEYCIYLRERGQGHKGSRDPSVLTEDIVVHCVVPAIRHTIRSARTRCAEVCRQMGCTQGVKLPEIVRRNKISPERKEKMEGYGGRIRWMEKSYKDDDRLYTWKLPGDHFLIGYQYSCFTAVSAISQTA